MSLIDEAKTNMTSAGPQCGVRILLSLHDGLEAELVEAIADPRVTMTAITAALRARYGDDVPRDNTLRRHRKGDCNCG